MRGVDYIPRYIMVGGFLGAGKTTAIIRLAEFLNRSGKRVGLISNDQGENLVDTALMKSKGFKTEEIAGGCFCCRFNSLIEAVRKLSNEVAPDIFIGEPVGSCTDLVATVTFPLRKLYGEEFVISPVSVLVDPFRAIRVFGIDRSPARNLSERVKYIYLKQLEEADAVVVNKCDAAEEKLLARLCDEIKIRFPEKPIFRVSAKTGQNLEQWFDFILNNHQSVGNAIDVDYEIYANGEAQLGWLNCAIEVSSRSMFNPNQIIKFIALEIKENLDRSNAEVAHLKMSFSPRKNIAGELAVVNLVRGDFIPELSFTLEEDADAGQLVINLRAEATPPILEQAVKTAIDTVKKRYGDIEFNISALERFSPAKPQPTHRLPEIG
jgi:G3E family GTPase